MAHQPLYIEEVESSNVDLMLSGHTHGGQLYPFRLFVKLQQPYIAGLYSHNENLQIYVNRGTGYWGPPMRLGVSSEYKMSKLGEKAGIIGACLLARNKVLSLVFGVVITIWFVSVLFTEASPFILV